ncbi:MAG TPA: discoidin domain-containing protein, partial [Polyangia bacterium]|nr:discoidin domain-containing protein [Polyangia bacterium]
RMDAPSTVDADHVEAQPEVGATFCLNSKWKASASASANVAPPSAGIDGNLTTRWGNGRLQDGTDWYKVDFGGSVHIDTITLDNTMAYPGDFPGAYAVYGSQDGTTFTGPFATGSGTNNTTVIRFAAQTVRAIKINQTGTSRTTNWWQVGELRINCLP